MADSNDTRVVIPVKSFTAAKRRLTDALSAERRELLARLMAEHVVAACAGFAVAVVCDDPAVARWARSLGAAVIDSSGEDLNGAISSARTDSAARGWPRMAVVHADLPLAGPFAELLATRQAPVFLVPDRRGEGTNVLVVPTDAPFRFEFGPGSFARHLAGAAELDLAVETIADDRYGWDIDEPADLLIPQRLVPDRDDFNRFTAAGLLTLATVDPTGDPCVDQAVGAGRGQGRRGTGAP